MSNALLYAMQSRLKNDPKKVASLCTGQLLHEKIQLGETSIDSKDHTSLLARLTHTS